MKSTLRQVTACMKGRRQGWFTAVALYAMATPLTFAALNAGDIVVLYPERPLPTRALYKVDPRTAAVQVVDDFATGNGPAIVAPDTTLSDLTVDQQGRVLLLATKRDAVTGTVAPTQVLRLDTDAGTRAVVSVLPPLGQGTALAMESTGELLAVVQSASADVHGLYRINASSGTSTRISNLDWIPATVAATSSIAVEPTGAVLVLEGRGWSSCPGCSDPLRDNNLWRIDLRAGTHQLIAALPKSYGELAISSDAKIAVAGSLERLPMRIDLVTGEATEIQYTSLLGGANSLEFHLALEYAGTVLRTDGYHPAAVNPPDVTHLFRVDPATGTEKIIAQFGDGTNTSLPAIVAVTPGQPSSPVITIVDATSQVLEATGPAGAVASYSPKATTAAGVSVPVSCSPGSGSTFPIGATTVSCTASANGTSASSSFKVTVRDTTPPSLVLPGPVSSTSTTVVYKASASDVVSGIVTPQCVPSSGSVFALGQTTVNCTATDAAGNSNTGSFVITVSATTSDKPIANNDSYGGGTHPIRVNNSREETIVVGRRLGVLANDLPANARGRSASLVNGPARTSGTGKAMAALKLDEDGSFELTLTAPSSAKSNEQRQAAKRGTYEFSYKMKYKGRTSLPAKVVVIVQ